MPCIKGENWQDLGKPRFCPYNISMSKVVPGKRRRGRLAVKSSSFQLHLKKKKGRKNRFCKNI